MNARGESRYKSWIGVKFSLGIEDSNVDSAFSDWRGSDDGEEVIEMESRSLEDRTLRCREGE